MTPASRAAEALLALADAIDAAGPLPGATTVALLAEDRREAVEALRALAASLPEPEAADARAQMRLTQLCLCDSDDMRRWARGWQAYAKRAA